MNGRVAQISAWKLHRNDFLLLGILGVALIASGCLFTAAVKREFSQSTLPAWLVNWLLIPVWWVGFLLVARVFVFALQTCFVTSLYFGLRALFLVPKVWQIATLSRMGRALLFGATMMSLFLIATVVAGLLTSSLYLAGLLILPALFFLSGVTTALQPPTFVVLAASSRETLSLQESLGRVVVPHRVVSLLRQYGDHWEHGAHVAADVLRTANEDDWRKAVEALIAIAVVVVVDARSHSEFVMEEVDRVLRGGHGFKTVFLIRGDYSSPVLQVLKGRLDPKTVWVQEFALPAFLWFVSRSRRNKPTVKQPAYQVARKQQEWIKRVAAKET